MRVVKLISCLSLRRVWTKAYIFVRAQGKIWELKAKDINGIGTKTTLFKNYGVWKKIKMLDLKIKAK